MNAIAGLAALSVLLAGPALTQDVGGPPPPPPPPASRTTADMSEWRAVPAENLLVIETTRGRILVELTPEVAPLHVERIKLLGERGDTERLRDAAHLLGLQGTLFVVSEGEEPPLSVVGDR